MCNDKYTLALAIKNGTKGSGLSCSLLEDRIVRGCSECNLEVICYGIDRVAEVYVGGIDALIRRVESRGESI